MKKVFEWAGRKKSVVGKTNKLDATGRKGPSTTAGGRRRPNPIFLVRDRVFQLFPFNNKTKR